MRIVEIATYLIELFTKIIKNPVGFLLAFIMIAVPTDLEIGLMFLAQSAKGSGYEFLGNIIFLGTGIYDKITLFIVEKFVGLAAFIFVIAIFVGTVLNLIGFKKFV